jgi:hypothetical protein
MNQNQLILAACSTIGNVLGSALRRLSESSFSRRSSEQIMPDFTSYSSGFGTIQLLAKTIHLVSVLVSAKAPWRTQFDVRRQRTVRAFGLSLEGVVLPMAHVEPTRNAAPQEPGVSGF